MSRLVVISNRVAPIVEGEPSAGGLAVGVYDALKQSGGVWFGWSGEVTDSTPEAVSLHDQDGVTYATTALSRRDYDQYYRGFSNATLWPTFHYRTDLSFYDRKEYAGYVRVNTWLAERLQPIVQPDDLLWAHDYHLLPFARACREIGITNKIGFFLHIPFPCEAVLRTVPPHHELIEGMCSYDLLGFQTSDDCDAFAAYVCRYFGGVRRSTEIIQLGDRQLHIGTYPIGILPDEIQQQSKSQDRSRQIINLKQGLQQRKLIMSVDRLDYSKGLVQRFQAFERLLEMAPSHRGQVSFIQIAPASRSDVEMYRNIRRQLESAAGRINGRWSDLAWTPIRYINKKYDRLMLMSLFRASQIGYVTPLRDGMNLVAKEYVAAQPEEDPGVLVLSEFAGAAHELGDGALLVNPYDIEGMAQALGRALIMPLEERKSRHQDMMQKLRENDLTRWRDRFLTDLRATGKPG